MIKCNVTIVGRVFRAPEIKNDRDGKPFVTFGLSTELKDNQETCDIDISVACDGEDDVVLGLSYGDRVKVRGVLTLKRREDVIYYNLSAEKIITVIYQYDYVESDLSGTHITPVSERHILNIHLNFKSGVPTVEDIQTPDIILPGTMLSIPEPYVTPGAYEITGGGWKLFDTESDAESHINGVEYTPLSDPLYLYQNKHYLAYYAKTYLGETFSNHVPVHVANYHDLKKVMDDKEHHY